MSGDGSNNRIDLRFAALRDEHRSGLIAFLTAGDPDIDSTCELLLGLPAAGADIIELGVPFSDPMADGPAIQASYTRALRNGTNLNQVLDLVRQFRRQDANTPIVLMGYYNPIYSYGVSGFVADARKAGVDGLIVVDLPREEDEQLSAPASAEGLRWIRMVAPTTDDDRLPSVLSNASGFVYYVSIKGITGTALAHSESVQDAVAHLKRHTDLPVAVGFGIRTPAQIAEVSTVADAVVVGTALVEAINENSGNNGLPNSGLADAVFAFVQSLAEACRRND